nr:sulfotransferase domain-containing protein [uncultured Carboxylicivirga sp.]
MNLSNYKKIAIHSVPRSGSTWLGSIFDSSPEVLYRYQPLFSYAFKDYLNEKSNENSIQSFYNNIMNSNDEFINQIEDKRSGKVPRFKKSNKITHVCYKEVRYHHIVENLINQCNDIKIVGLVRNPMATIYSWLNAPKEFRKDLGWKWEKEWVNAPLKNNDKTEEFNGYIKWKEVALLFDDLANKYPDNFYLIQYSNLLKDTTSVIKSVFDFCDINLSKQTIDFINNSKSRNNEDAYSVYKQKSVDDSWKSKLHPEIITHITKDLEGSILEKYILND